MNITVKYVHAVLDYGIGGLLLIGPWLFGFEDHLAATLYTVAFGAVMIGYSLFTDYEPSYRRKIPLVLHMGLEGLCGGLLIGAPWMFGFANVTWVPHLVIGIVTAARPVLFLVGLGIEHRLESWNAAHPTV